MLSPLATVVTPPAPVFNIARGSAFPSTQVYMAKLAEQAERFDEMVLYMKVPTQVQRRFSTQALGLLTAFLFSPCNLLQEVAKVRAEFS
ncbi:MAG: hypothetical protein BJ554DRAFT_809 [Olpidium bornovanus]|uniref:Uncharacterized protein n=1 Tax=Olpidium bornovanus TaxID=278681 RepID=A0A8H8DM11_9FUNG|nr:MAG: hypothetical protein BJ554DRAFT_809 [Olpidium bornovanus]